jgi:hypothetical protein
VQEDHEFEASLDYIMRLKKKMKKKEKGRREEEEKVVEESYQ